MRSPPPLRYVSLPRQLAPAPPLRAPFHALVARILRWTISLASFAGATLWDRLWGRRDLRKLAVRLCACFERIGGVAVKIGQQMSVRHDLLPPVVCNELAQLTDRVAPSPSEYAVARVEEAIGGPLEGTFRVFEREPIGSASIATVYYGVLHSGEEVAVKVLRPDAPPRIACDLKVVDLLTRLCELLTLVRFGFFANLRKDLRAMFSEELDFRAEARKQRLFRKSLRRDRIDWVHTPRVFSELCNDHVIVSEFVRGIPCATLLATVEGDDPEARRVVEEAGIDPAKVGDAVLTLGLWSQQEGIFFHADPHPGNFIILPGNVIAVIDFGACGITMGVTAAMVREIPKGWAQRDPYHVAAASLVLAGPYPAIDFAALRNQAEDAFANFYLHYLDPKSPWWARTSAGVWLEFLGAVREHKIPVNLETLRQVRATLLYDTLAARLNPALDLQPYLRQRQKAARRLARRVARRARTELRERRARTQRSLGGALEAEERQLQTLVKKTAFLQRAPSKGSFGLRIVLETGRTAALALGAGWALLGAGAGLGAWEPLAPAAALGFLGTHPVFLALLAGSILRSLRRSSRRFLEPDPLDARPTVLARVLARVL